MTGTSIFDSTRCQTGAKREQGVALVMALVFLLLLTLIGVTAMSTTALEEKMAGNMKDKNAAFQAAESALIVAENWILSLTDKPDFPDNSKGLYQPYTCASAPEKPVWDCVTWTGSSNLVVYPKTPGGSESGGLNGIATQPKYIVEDLQEIPESGGTLKIPPFYKGKGSSVMRITAYGTGGTNSAVSLLQSTYSRPF